MTISIKSILTCNLKLFRRPAPIATFAGKNLIEGVMMVIMMMMMIMMMVMMIMMMLQLVAAPMQTMFQTGGAVQLATPGHEVFAVQPAAPIHMATLQVWLLVLILLCFDHVLGTKRIFYDLLLGLEYVP